MFILYIYIYIYLFILYIFILYIFGNTYIYFQIGKLNYKASIYLSLMGNNITQFLIICRHISLDFPTKMCDKGEAINAHCILLF